MGDVDFGAITEVQRKTWGEGDFSMVAGLVMMVAEELAESLEILAGDRVLDVACGSGNGALAAARRSWGNVVGTDFVPPCSSAVASAPPPSASTSSSSRPMPPTCRSRTGSSTS